MLTKERIEKKIKESVANFYNTGIANWDVRGSAFATGLKAGMNIGVVETLDTLSEIVEDFKKSSYSQEEIVVRLKDFIHQANTKRK